MATTITPIPQNFTITERGGSSDKYPNVKRQVRRRLEEIDNQIAALEAKKKTILEAAGD